MEINTQELSRWLAIGANVGVLVGLILVGYEVNQNNRLTRATLVNEGNVVGNQLFASVMGENPSEAITRAYECPEKMDFTDFVVVDTYLYTGINNVYRSYLLAKEGIFTDAEWKAEVGRYASWYFGSGFPRDWWFKESEPSFDPEFTAYVRDALNKRVQAFLDGGTTYGPVPIHRLKQKRSVAAHARNQSNKTVTEQSD